MKKLILFIGEKCNNECVMCSVNKLKFKDVLGFDALADVIKKRKEEYDAIEFTGGEPMEHPDIIRLCKLANELGYEEISMSTNGRNFFDKEITKQLAKNGLKMVCVAVHGSDEVYDLVTGQKDGYREVVEGIKNLKKEGVDVTVSFVMLKINTENFKKHMQKLMDLGVDTFVIADLLLPHERSINEFSEISISYKEKKSFFYNNFDLLKGCKRLIFANFARCVLPVNIPSSWAFFGSFEKAEKNWEDGGIDSPKYSNKKIKKCLSCPYEKKCQGFFSYYLDFFGEDDALEMLKVDNFIENSKIA